ncbi:MAG: helix-turn-helix domain-containing protein [Kiritimatiellae bacterium]|nr:helix-turn-helix domain-containing protein [Kiritimatiellia bacterium]
MIDAATLAPLLTLAERVLAFPDVDAACVLLFMQGLGPQKASEKLSIVCGEAERLAEALERPETAREYERRLADTFAPFADIVRAILPEGETRYTRMTRGYKRTTLASLAKAEAKRRKKEARCIARHVATYEEAAEILHIKKQVVREYVHKGKFVGVYHEGQNCAYGVTRQSIDVYAQKQERRAAAVEKTDAIKAHRREWRENGGVYYTQDGRKIYGAERVSAKEVAATVGKVKCTIRRWANEGRIERVYIDAERNYPGGYLRATVEKWTKEREAITAAGGIYYTNAGQIVGAERVSREETAKRLHLHAVTVTAICRRGELEHVYADAARTIPCGYTRKSVEAYAQAHPIHIPAKRAVAAPDFKIETLPPPPRSPRLHAARLDPDAESADSSAVIEGAEEWRKRERPLIVFRLALAATIPPDEREQDMEGQELQDDRDGAKLQVAKAYTVHEDGMIRAICVSEADRDEIVAALALYRKAKAAPGEIEAALALYRTAKGILGQEQSDEPQTAAEEC